MNHTELDLIVAELMFPILVKLAPTGNTIGYKEIADLIKANNPEITEISNITQSIFQSRDEPERGLFVSHLSGSALLGFVN